MLGDFYLQSAVNNPDRLHVVFIIEIQNIDLHNKIAEWVGNQVSKQTPLGNIWYSSTDPQKIQEVTGETLSANNGVRFAVFKGEKYQMFIVATIAELENFLKTFSVDMLHHAFSRADADDDEL